MHVKALSEDAFESEVMSSISATKRTTVVGGVVPSRHSGDREREREMEVQFARGSYSDTENVSATNPLVQCQYTALHGVLVSR